MLLSVAVVFIHLVPCKAILGWHKLAVGVVGRRLALVAGLVVLASFGVRVHLLGCLTAPPIDGGGRRRNSSGGVANQDPDPVSNKQVLLGDEAAAATPQPPPPPPQFGGYEKAWILSSIAQDYL